MNVLDEKRCKPFLVPREGDGFNLLHAELGPWIGFGVVDVLLKNLVGMAALLVLGDGSCLLSLGIRRGRGSIGGAISLSAQHITELVHGFRSCLEKSDDGLETLSPTGPKVVFMHIPAPRTKGSRAEFTSKIRESGSTGWPAKTVQRPKRHSGRGSDGVQSYQMETGAESDALDLI